MKITVKILEDGNPILAKVLDEGVYRAGRSDFSDLVLPHDSVSRSHLEIRVTEAAVYLTNMSGAGKVKINGQSVETAELADGDEVSVGPFRIIVFHGERADALGDANVAMPPPLGGAPDSEAPPAEGGLGEM